jgi:hypothetical protein
MKVLIACEESQVVTIEFRKLGHEAFSCDIIDCSGGHPEWHIKDDVLKHLDDGWDMMIAFPPCTYLSKAGARWWKQEGREEKSIKAFHFVKALYNSNISKIAVENPRGKLNNYWRYPDQVIQPYWFGDPYSKATCLWLKNIPPLISTGMTSSFVPFICSNTGGAKRGQKHTSGIARNQKQASKTFPGIARAMAEQWGGQL